MQKKQILLVDDTPVNLTILQEVLEDSYILQFATDGLEALEAVEESPPDLILLDIMMPKMDGTETCKRLKESEETRDIPVIFLTALDDIAMKIKGFSLGAADYLTKPFIPEEIKIRVENHLALSEARKVLKDENTRLEDLVKKRTKSIIDTRDVTIRMAASLAETRDNETGNHILRTQRYVEVLATEYQKDHSSELPGTRDLEILVKSAPLHDIGKIGVPDAILLKPGKLSPEEFEEMKKHTVYGSRALLRAEEESEGGKFLKVAREIAFSHHEKWDGSGYPQGLKELEIPLSGRIMAIADVYDALISPRVYKPPFTHSKAASIIKEGRGNHFDPELCDIFLELEERFREIALALAETEEHKQYLTQ